MLTVSSTARFEGFVAIVRCCNIVQTKFWKRTAGMLTKNEDRSKHTTSRDRQGLEAAELSTGSDTAGRMMICGLLIELVLSS
jgi:hypothetical protein